MADDSRKPVRELSEAKSRNHRRTVGLFRLLPAQPEVRIGVQIRGGVRGWFTVHTSPLESGLASGMLHVFRRNHHGLAKAA